MGFQVISFRCVLKNKLGRVLSSSFSQDILTASMGEDDLLAGLAHELKNLRAGEKRKISLKAEQAYGFYDMKKVRVCSREDLPESTTVTLGTRVRLEESAGRGRMFRVTQIEGDRITLDSNHPLAGQDLVFEIEVLKARDATPEDFGTVEDAPYH